MNVFFGEFEFDSASGELLRGGSRVPIQEKPLRLLSLLLAHAGELVTRRQIAEAIWPGTHVAQDESVNTAIRKIRLALNDSPTSPRFIETVGSRGYRFIHTVIPESPRPTTARSLTLAVLPLENLGIPTDEQFSEGITEEMISKLGRLRPRLSIIALSSVLRYRRASGETGRILNELGANYILSGSIRRAGSRIRVSARLIDGSDQSCAWSGTFERDWSDISNIQNEVAEGVARATMRVLARETAQHPSSAAHEIYLRGRHFWNKRNAQGLLKSIELFNTALTQDPYYALCYVGLADAYVMLSQHGVLSGAQALPIAREAAFRALAIDPSSAEVHASLAWVKGVYDHDLAGAQEECKTAIDLNPDYSFAYIAYSFMLTALGRHTESLALLRRGLRIDPVSLPINSIYATALYFARQHDAAIEQCLECKDLDSRFSMAYAVHGQALEAKGSYDEALQQFQRNAELSPWNPFSWAHLARLSAVKGDIESSRNYLSRLFADSGDKYVPPYFVAQVYGALGDIDKAFQWLHRAERERSNWVLFLAVDPKFDCLRHDRRIVQLLETLGISNTHGFCESGSPYKQDGGPPQA